MHTSHLMGESLFGRYTIALLLCALVLLLLARPIRRLLQTQRAET